MQLIGCQKRKTVYQMSTDTCPNTHLFCRLLMALLIAVWSFGMMPSTRITVFTFSLWFIVVLLLLVDPFAAEDFGGATPFFWFGDLSLLLRLSELWRGSELFPPRRFCRSLKGRWLEKLFFESRRLSDDSFFESRPFSRKSLLSEAVSHSSPSLEGCFWRGGFLLVVDAGALLPRPLEGRPRLGVPRSKPRPLSFIPPRRNLGGGGLRSCRRLSRRLLSMLHKWQQNACQFVSSHILTVITCAYLHSSVTHFLHKHNNSRMCCLDSNFVKRISHLSAYTIQVYHFCNHSTIGFARSPLAVSGLNITPTKTKILPDQNLKQHPSWHGLSTVMWSLHCLLQLVSLKKPPHFKCLSQRQKRAPQISLQTLCHEIQRKVTDLLTLLSGTGGPPWSPLPPFPRPMGRRPNPARGGAEFPRPLPRPPRWPGFPPPVGHRHVQH